MKCCFIGHRNIKITEELKQKVREMVEDLIAHKNVFTFFWGSRNNFKSLSHLVVIKLKEKYSKIKSIAYTCKSETCVLESERDKWEKIYSRLQKQ